MADGRFVAAVTFLQEAEVRSLIEECLQAACFRAFQQEPDARIADAFLAHSEQRFRLSYPLGSWPRGDAEDDFWGDDETEDELEVGKSVSATEAARNQARLVAFINRIKKLSQECNQSVELGQQNNLNDTEEITALHELFDGELSEQEEFKRLTANIMQEVKDRFKLVQTGSFTKSSTGWPVIWSTEESSRNKFLEQIQWFSSNDYKQYGRLLTPLVNGMRVRGPFKSRLKGGHGAHKLVLIDGEGIGHSAQSATSISTSMTGRFSAVDMILLVDNAQQPMQAAPLELLRSVGSSGYADKLAVAFTHFDSVKGPNLPYFPQKREHVMLSVRDAIGTLKVPLGAPMAAKLEKQIENQVFFLGELDQEVDKLTRKSQVQMRELLQAMQQTAEPLAPIEAAPIYKVGKLEEALDGAVKSFHELWQGRLDGQPPGKNKVHWGKIKALTRRLADAAWGKNEYDFLRPVAELTQRWRENVSKWIDTPIGWTTKNPQDDDVRNLALTAIRRSVAAKLDLFIEMQLVDKHRDDWRAAYGESGQYSSYRRAKKIKDCIYKEAAPHSDDAMSGPARTLRHNLRRLVQDAVEDAGGWLS